MANINGINPPILNDQDYVEKITDSFTAVDEHDHSPGKGVPLSTSSLADGAITDAKVSASAGIARSKLAAGVAHRIVINDSNGVMVDSTALTNGQLLIGATGAAPVAATLTGTANQVAVTNGVNSIGLSLPQDMHSGASPTFNGLTVGALTGPIKGAAGVLSAGDVNLASEVTGTLPVGNGGTGVTSLSDIVGTVNQVAVSNGVATIVGGNVTLSLPQDIATSSAVQFGSTLAGSGAIDDTAILQANSTVKGFLPPRMTTAQRDAITSPAEGLIIHNTSTSQLNIYNGASWGAVGGGTYVESFTGTSITGTNDATQVWRYTGGSAQVMTAIDVTALGDGGLIEVMGTDNDDTITLNNNDTAGGWLINGSWVGYRGSKIILRRDVGLDLLVEVSRNGL